jgi:hypothetical protein
MSVFLTLVGPAHRTGPAPALSKEERLRFTVRPVEEKEGCNAYSVRLAATEDWRRTDTEVKEWAQWFSAEHGRALCRRHGARGFHIKEMDFSGNMLGNEALEAALAAVAGWAERIDSVKFHHNRLSRGDAIEQLLRSGCTHQVHLSHNLLPDGEMAALVRAAVGATGAEGKPLYPLRATLPLWLRMEHNPGHGGPLTAAAIRDGRARVCHANVHAGWCTPFTCAKHQKPPAVHLTYLDAKAAGEGTTREAGASPNAQTAPRAPAGGATAWAPCAPCAKAAQERTKAPEERPTRKAATAWAPRAPCRKDPEDRNPRDDFPPLSPVVTKGKKPPQSASAWLELAEAARLSTESEESRPPPHLPPPPPRSKPQKADTETKSFARPLVY